MVRSGSRSGSAERHPAARMKRSHHLLRSVKRRMMQAASTRPPADDEEFLARDVLVTLPRVEERPPGGLHLRVAHPAKGRQRRHRVPASPALTVDFEEEAVRRAIAQNQVGPGGGGGTDHPLELRFYLRPLAEPRLEPLLDGRIAARGGPPIRATLERGVVVGSQGLED